MSASNKSNRKIRRNLEKVYGKGCFFARAHCAERIEKMGGIKTFKRFTEEKRFTGKKISHQLSLHHLKHRSEGGETTMENGANLEEIAHQYIHSLPREQEEMVNDMLREFKAQIKPNDISLQVVDLSVEDKGIDCNSLGTFEIDLCDTLDISLKDMTPEVQKKREKFNRTKEKRKFERLIIEELEIGE